VLRVIDFLLKETDVIDSTSSPLWRLVTWIQICASLKHRKVKKAQPSRLIPR